MRILHSVAPATVGGLEEVVVRLAAGLVDRGHEVRVVAVVADSESHPFVESLISAGVDVDPMVVPPRRYRQERAGVRRICEQWRPHVVHTHGYRPDVLHRGPARRLGIPLVSTLHGFTGGGLKNRLYERLQLRSVRSFDAVVAVSRPMADRLLERGFPESSIHVIPNAWAPRAEVIDPAAARVELGVETGRPHIGWVGRLSREKGPDILLQAVAGLGVADLGAAGGNDPVISLVGDGPLREELESLARSGVPAPVDVRFHGALPGAARFFPAFDLFVLSSRTEGTPMVLFEAMAAGIPVVTTAVGGIPDVVGPAEALLVPSEDPAALAAGIREVLRNPIQAHERAERARTRLAKAFAPGPWLERHEALYTSVTRDGATAPRSGSIHPTRGAR